MADVIPLFALIQVTLKKNEFRFSEAETLKTRVGGKMWG